MTDAVGHRVYGMLSEGERRLDPLAYGFSRSEAARVRAEVEVSHQPIDS